MKIVGVGAGPGLLTEDAIREIRNAKVIFGSRRAIELAGRHIKCEVHEIEDYSLNSLPDDAVVLSTGDPMLSGLGKFARKEDEIITGISSLQLACSRLHMDIENFSIITSHSKDFDAIKDKLRIELKNGRHIFLLPGPAFRIRDLAGFLRSEGFSMQISICERLAYADERITTGTTENPPVRGSDMYCIVISR